jgi:hypothetical protein
MQLTRESWWWARISIHQRTLSQNESSKNATLEVGEKQTSNQLIFLGALGNKEAQSVLACFDLSLLNRKALRSVQR